MMSDVWWESRFQGLKADQPTKQQQKNEYAFLSEAGKGNNVMKVFMSFSSKYSTCLLCNEGFFLTEYKKAINPNVSCEG